MLSTGARPPEKPHSHPKVGLEPSSSPQQSPWVDDNPCGTASLSGYRLSKRNTALSKRIALLIGVRDYEGEDALITPLEDVRLVRTALESRSFACHSLENPTLAEIMEAVDRFTADNRDADHAVLYFSGHGFEHFGKGVVLPIDFPFPLTAWGLHQFGMPVSELEEAFRHCAGVGVLVLDACREPLDPAEVERWTQLGARQGGPVGDQPNLLVAWSTSAGAVAWDGEGVTSRYTTAFAEQARDHTIDLDDMFARVGKAVDAGSQRQHPWVKSGLRSPAAWTDLPRFHAPTIVQTPLRSMDHGPLTLMRSRDGADLLVTGRNRALWNIRSKDGEMTRAALLPHDALTADFLPKGLVATQGAIGVSIVRAGATETCALDQDYYGLRAAPGGAHAIAYDTARLVILDLSGAAPVVTSRRELPFDPYGAVFKDDRFAWVVGSQGAVARIDVQTGEFVEVTQRSPHVDHLNDVAVLEDGDLVIVGSDGSVRRCRPKTGRPTVLTRTRNVDYGGYDPLPDTASLCLEEIWLERLGEDHALFCDVSPDGPLIAVAMADGEVHAVDARDGSTVTHWPARLSDMSLQGVAFTADGALATLHGDGAVTLARPR